MPAADQAPAYPETRKEPLVEEFFGEKVADPYRWLENDVRVDKEVAAWVDAQNAATAAHLKTVPGRDVLAQRMKQLFDYERFGIPTERGGKYFYMRNDGLQNQSVLYVRDGLEGEGRVLIDPNTWAKDGATALDAWVPSADGKRLIYSVQDGGTDWRIIRVLDVETGKPLADEIRWAKFTGLSWVGPDAFLYSRFPAPEEGAAFQSLNLNQTIYYHRIGTPQSADVPVYATPDRPELNHVIELTHDDRWAIITSSSGTDEKYELHAVALDQGDWTARPLIKGFENDWRLIEGIGDNLWFVTDKDAARLKVVKADMSAANPVFTDVVPEKAETLAGASIVGDKLILSYLKDAQSAARMLTLDGVPVKEIALNDIGTASGFGGKPGKTETFFAFSSFTQPGAIYRLDTATGETSVFAKPKLAFNPDDYETRQTFYPSKDGTRIPMFIIKPKAATGPVPTILYGYGGFNISVTPGYSATRMAWLQSGGAFAVANIRGGGEYGKAWHDAGRRANKQNVFDDFIAAGEWLIANGVTPRDGLAVEGRSNGGLLIGAVVNQRPDLFAAGHAAVGVMDMLRFDKFTAGRYWVDDYGYPERKEDWTLLRAYSPYHNVKSGTAYPAIMVSTADTDDRVVPGHSFKYTAALQAADIGDKPHLIRIETRAGHGAGKPTDKVIAEFSDIYAFLAKWTGLKLVP